MGGGGSKFKHINRENPLRTWAITGELGSGTYGKVHAVRHRETRQEAAAKVAPIKDEDQLMNFHAEICILHDCHHENMTNFIDAFYDEGNLWILIEQCVGGALKDVIRKRKRGLAEAEIRCCAYQMLSGLAYLHENNVVHRDINASNTLLAAGGVVKLADFGVSARLKTEASRRTSFIGSPHWMAPEVVRCENSQENPYTNVCDVWSFGITCIELAEQNPPNSDLHPMKVLFKITGGPPPTLADPKAWSASFPAFLATALVKDPAQRPGARQLQAHEFARNQSDRLIIENLIWNE